MMLRQWRIQDIQGGGAGGSEPSDLPLIQIPGIFHNEFFFFWGGGAKGHGVPPNCLLASARNADLSESH